MRSILGATLLLAMTAVAFAGGDLYAPSPLAQYSWMGPYIGGTVGYQWGSVSHSPVQPSGIAGGLEGGYNWQRGNFVYGLETDLNLSGADATVAPFEFSNPWFGTVRGRGGVAIGNVLVYGTAGFSYGDLRADSAGLTESHAEVGWTAGAGVEVDFSHRWSAKAEWLYLDLIDRSFAVSGNNNGLATNLLRFGVNYHF
jgi:outer membrane immunogenic protein